MRTRRAALSAASLSLAIVCPAAPVFAVFDLHFDYTSFETGFQQPHFNVLNYSSINGNYMMTSTDNHRPEMVANGNALAQFYNNFNADYNHPTAERRTPAEEAAHINTYTINNSTNNGARPEWLILNEISSSQWQLNPGAPSLSEHRTWVIDTVTLLNDVYGYKVITYSPYETVGTANAPSWQALAAKSYIGIESYQSGTEVWNSGTTNAARLAWVQGRYQNSKNTYLATGVPESRLFISEHFANNNATYVDNQGVTRTTGWGRAGLASAADWDTVIMMRQDAMKNVGFAGFLAYNWGGNAMGVTQAEQLQHEYYYRSRLVLPTQQPQWLSDSSINVNGTVIPLSWNEPLNWIGGVPNASGAVANFYRTNTAARTVTLDGSKTVGTLTFNSPQSYTIAAGTGGSVILSNGAASANLAVAQGSHTIAAPLQLNSSANAAITSGTLTISGATSGVGAIVKSGAGTLALSNSANNFSGSTTINGGVVTVTADTCLGQVPLGFTSNAITLNGGTWRNVGSSAITIPANRGITVLSGGGTLDFSSSSGVPALNAKITGGGTITKMGVKTVLVGSDSSSSFSGNWIIRQGRVNVNANATVNSLGTGTITLSPGNGAVAQLGIGGSGGVDAELANPIVLAATGNGINSFEINAGNTLTFSGVISGSGGLQKSGGSSSGTQGGAPLVTTGTMVLAGNNTYTGGTTVLAGTLRIVNAQSLPSGQPLTISGTSSVVIPSNGTNNLTPRIGAMSITTGGKLDLQDNKLVVTATPLGSWNGSAYTGVTGLIQSGRGNGSWNGATGIITSMSDATVGVLTTLAVANASDTNHNGSTFGGVSVSGGDVLVMYTWGGDADLDGDLDGDDYFHIDSNVSMSGSVFGYHSGDFNYDGTLDGDDYFIIDSNIATAQSIGPIGSGAAAMSDLAHAVPEPGGIALILACAAVTRRRRRV